MSVNPPALPHKHGSLMGPLTWDQAVARSVEARQTSHSASVRTPGRGHRASGARVSPSKDLTSSVLEINLGSKMSDPLVILQSFYIRSIILLQLSWEARK